MAARSDEVCLSDKIMTSCIFIQFFRMVNTFVVYYLMALSVVKICGVDDG
jgi:hypothetical protein